VATAKITMKIAIAITGASIGGRVAL